MESSEDGELLAMLAMLAEMFRENGVDPRDIELLVSKFINRKVLTCLSDMDLPISQEIFKEILDMYDFLKKFLNALSFFCVIESNDLDKKLELYAISFVFNVEEAENKGNIEERITDLKNFFERNLFCGNKLVLKTGAHSNLEVCLEYDHETFIDAVRKLCQ